jgi:hypothetical protein
MNHKKLIPANGISTAAVVMPPRWLFSHSSESCILAGIFVRISTRVMPKRIANTIPASAAALGVVNCRRLGPDGRSEDVDTSVIILSTRRRLGSRFSLLA